MRLQQAEREKEQAALDAYEDDYIREVNEAAAAYEDHLNCTQQYESIDDYLKIESDIEREQYEEELKSYEPGYHVQEIIKSISSRLYATR
jgi:hypothetical protein